MKKYFYIRVSDRDKIPDRQIVDAKKLGISDDNIYVEKASGKDFKCPTYHLMKKILIEGDILYTKSLDRLGRNKQMILDEWQNLTKVLKVDIVVVDMPLLDTTKYKEIKGMETLICDIVLQLLSFMAEDERTRINQRQGEGIKIAKENGIKFGRKKIEITEKFIEIYTRWKGAQITAVKAMELLKMNKSTFYRRVKEHENTLL